MTPASASVEKTPRQAFATAFVTADVDMDGRVPEAAEPAAHAPPSKPVHGRRTAPGPAEPAAALSTADDWTRKAEAMVAAGASRHLKAGLVADAKAAGFVWDASAAAFAAAGDVR